jgi:hypothetical protein
MNESLAAASFTTGTIPCILESATPELMLGSKQGTYTARASIHVDDAGIPGALFEDLGSQEVTGAVFSQHELTFPASGTHVLNGNATYWLVVTADVPPSPDAPTWVGTSSTSEWSPAGWTISDDTLRSFDNGTTWGHNVGNPMQLSIQGSLIPEPSTFVTLTGLLGMGLLGHWWRRRRRKRGHY